MNVKKPIGVGLLVALAAVLAMALMAPLASATRVTPPGDTIAASLKSGTAKFITENAFASTSIRCEASTTGGTIPTQVEPSTQNNTNRTGTGTNSEGPGGVYVALNTPTFTSCGFFIGNTKQAKPTVTVSTSAGWSLTHDAITATALPAFIAVPQKGAIINLEGGACKIEVSPNGATAAAGRFTNGTNSTTAPSTLKVDSQIPFVQNPAGCAEVNQANPAQFEALYQVKDTTNTAKPVRVEE